MDLSQFRVVRLNAESFPVSPHEREAAEKAGLTVRLSEATGNEILEVASQCDALLVVATALPREVIAGLEKCRVISRMGAGTDKIDCAAATQQGIVVANVPDFCVEEQADHALALLLALVRKLPAMDAAARNGQWEAGRHACRSIHRFAGRTLGLVGWGRSAKALARRAQGFEMRMLAARKSNRADREMQELNVQLVELDELVRESDYLSLHLPLTADSFHLLDRSRLRQMKPDAYLVNTSRGGLVDETALAELLAAGHLAGAGLDTFHEVNVHGQEQTPDHPLFSLPNVILSPHVAAFSVESSRDVGYGAVENVRDCLEGYWPPVERIVNGGVEPRFGRLGRRQV